MPKLAKALAKNAKEKAGDWQSFEALEPGLYLVRLRKVDDTGEGKAGPYWTWETETVEVGDQPTGRRFWDITSLSEKAIGRMGKVFESFGVPTDTNTDDLIGNLVCQSIGVEIQRQGERTGEKRNVVREWLPADAHPLYEEFEGETNAATGKVTDPDAFG